MYGGYCSFGVSSEYCNFDFVWDKDCLGLEASINAWQYIDEKLYLYRSSKPLELFNTNQDIMIKSADQRWSSWFNKSEIIVNSGCMLEDVTDSVG